MNGTLTSAAPEQMRRLSAYARRHHVDLVPHQQFFGHLHNLLQYELYAGLGEIPHGSVLSPANAEPNNSASAGYTGME